MRAIEFTSLQPLPGLPTTVRFPATTGPVLYRYPVSLVWGRRWKSRLRLRDGLEFGTIDLGGES